MHIDFEDDAEYEDEYDSGVKYSIIVLVLVLVLDSLHSRNRLFLTRYLGFYLAPSSSSSARAMATAAAPASAAFSAGVLAVSPGGPVFTLCGGYNKVLLCRKEKAHAHTHRN